MSSFKCKKCGTDIIDSKDGYLTGCKHWPIEGGHIDKLDELIEKWENKSNELWNGGDCDEIDTGASAAIEECIEDLKSLRQSLSNIEVKK